ncbi:Meckel syndrome type 1 protein [Harmonia axyridis]|uniref:Meckel syndrome type 1 protein n=1 Tax=Harmonia axyridis TaxID=115357 RepID=UPI001E275B44|nr:Meckel syndrome type 1 protein [Harmonia axyridis]
MINDVLIETCDWYIITPDINALSYIEEKHYRKIIKTMHQFHPELNRYTGVYRCSDNINNFKIRVKIKEIPDIALAAESDLTEGWEIKEFKWQQKIFNNFEKQFYGQEKNCITDVEKQYHSIIKNSVTSPDDKMLFSYVDNDNFDHTIENASLMKSKLKVKQTKEDTLEEIVDVINEFDYEYFLQQSLDDLGISEEIVSMYIMADAGEYVQENWIKFEHIICVVKYDRERNVLRVYPDFSKDIPYHLQIDNDISRNFYFFIENASESIPEDLSQIEGQIFKKIADYRNSLKNISLSTDFELPSRNKLEVHIFFEIVSGEGFEYNDIYVKYFVELPDKWTCKKPESLEGSTQTCRARYEGELLVFGHVFDVVLEYDIQDFAVVGFPEYPCIYFEVISKGTWERYRCEGLTYHCLPIAKPGIYEYHLPCFRFSEGVISELRRFFIGDCSNYSDITWIGLPKSTEGSVFNKFGIRTVGTGTLNIRMNMIHQSQAFLTKYNETEVIKSKEKFIFEKLNSSSLVKSVEQVLEAFRRARRNMIEARQK